eukprot:m.33155 g.33155  ORF g.33155 m.33155 type:complete len:512 (+) comp5078_c0_seq1:47-1582(+)
MSFMHEVKYRGCIQITGWAPSHAQPRPGLVEANAALKRLLAQDKHSTLCVLSASSEMGLKCVDTSFNPPKVVMSNTISEIAHCNVDVSKPEFFTCIVGGGKSGPDQLFFCHVFKCQNKETANKITRAVASACTLAYQAHLDRQRGSAPPPTHAAPPPSGNFSRGTPPSHGPDSRQSFQRSVRGTIQRQSIRAQASPYGGVPLVPKLTDAWFRPSMGRQDVANILKDSRPGDFIIRESQTQPGDYALAVQTGNNVWTGLIINTPAGLQIGRNGTAQFNELTDLVQYYMANTFMEDAFGQPLYLRLPYDQGPAGPRDNRPAFKNPPMFAAGGGGGFGEEEASPMPACGWPESDGEEDAPSFLGGGGGGGKKAGNELMDEKDAFESIMNGGITEDHIHAGVDLADVGRALDAASSGSPGKGDGLHSYSRDLYATLPVDGENFLDGKDARDVLMRSGLDTQTLGTIWMEVDQERRGKIDQDQFTLILGLISQAQSGLPVSLEALNVDAIDPPFLQ